MAYAPSGALANLVALLAQRPTGGVGLGPVRPPGNAKTPIGAPGFRGHPVLGLLGAKPPPGAIHAPPGYGGPVGVGDTIMPTGGAGIGPPAHLNPGGVNRPSGGVPHQHPVLRGPIGNPGGSINPEGGVTPHPPTFGSGPSRQPGIGTPVNPEGGVTPHAPTFGSGSPQPPTVFGGAVRFPQRPAQPRQRGVYYGNGNGVRMR